MHSSSRHRLVFPSALLLLLAAACHDVGQPRLDPARAAGTYVLESVSGRYAPVSGNFVLTADGQAERRVHYPALAGDTAQDNVAVGTFQLPADNAIDFALQQSCGGPACVWHIRATRAGERFTIRYPDPADGPDIVETYRRL